MQALESANLSLAEFRKRSGFAEPSKSSRTRRKDLEDALMVVFWGFSLQARTRLTSAYALEQFFEPAAFYRDASDRIRHRNKWSSYLAGRARPKVVLAAVASKCPGGNECLDSPIWPALTSSRLTRRNLEALLLRLDPKVLALVRRPAGSPAARSADQAFYARRQAEALERRAGLDALAAAVILLRIAHVENESAAAYQWGRHVLRIALMLGELLKEGGVARALLELLDERILMLAEHNGVRPGIPSDHFIELSTHYATALRRVEGKPFDSLSAAQRLAVGQRLFDFRAGFDYFHAFNPIRVVRGTEGASDCRPCFIATDLHLHSWALNMLSLGGHHHLPPAAARAGDDLWRAREGTMAHRVMSLLAPTDLKEHIDQRLRGGTGNLNAPEAMGLSSGDGLDLWMRAIRLDGAEECLSQQMQPRLVDSISMEIDPET